jgi:hypothetical protein
VAYASIAGRAFTDSENPSAHGICDRCGFRYNLRSLSWQFDWAGTSMINKRILVCQSCKDDPQEQLRSITLPADPVPVRNPRAENFVNAETDYRVTEDGDRRITMNDDYRVTQQTGEPPYGLNEEPGISVDIPDDIGGDDPGLPYNNDEVPKTGSLE